MATIFGTSGNNTFNVINPGDFVIDGLAGVDTLNLGTEARSRFRITEGVDGSVLVDAISSASGAFHATLFHFEKIIFNNNLDTLDLATFFLDTVAPTVVSFNPIAQATDFLPNRNIVITFSESITRGTGAILLKTADGAIVATYDAATSNNLAFSGSTLAIDPTLDLDFNKTYKIEFSAGSVKDLKGNPYAGSNNYSFTTTADSAVINGTAASETLVGSGGKDIINAGAGNDFITGNGGDDSLNGGAGLDTARYADKKSDYVVSATGSDFTVREINAHDGTDTLNQIERIQFSDGAVALDVNGIAGQAYRLYQAAFGRKPDLEGLGYWINDMDNGSSLTTVAAGFFQSAEFQKLYGTSPSIVILITNFYANVLHRAPDQAGFEYWENQLNKGEITQAGALASFCESVENQAQVIGTIQNGIDYLPWLG